MDRRDFLQQTLIATVTVPGLLEASQAAVSADDRQLPEVAISETPVDLFELRLGRGLLPPLFTYGVEAILSKIRMLRERLRSDAIPVEMPLLRLRDDVSLEEHSLMVLIQGQPLFSRFLPPSYRTGEKVAKTLLASVELAARRHFRTVTRQHQRSSELLLTAEEIRLLKNSAKRRPSTELTPE